MTRGRFKLAVGHRESKNEPAVRNRFNPNGMGRPRLQRAQALAAPRWQAGENQVRRQSVFMGFGCGFDRDRGRKSGTGLPDRCACPRCPLHRQRRDGGSSTGTRRWKNRGCWSRPPGPGCGRRIKLMKFAFHPAEVDATALGDRGTTETLHRSRWDVGSSRPDPLRVLNTSTARNVSPWESIPPTQ